MGHESSPLATAEFVCKSTGIEHHVSLLFYVGVVKIGIDHCCVPRNGHGIEAIYNVQSEHSVLLLQGFQRIKDCSDNNFSWTHGFFDIGQEMLCTNGQRLV